MGALKIFGLEGIKEGTYVPSPRYKNGTEVVKHMMEEKYGQGATMANDDSNWVLTHGGPFKPEVIREITKDPAVRVSPFLKRLMESFYTDFEHSFTVKAGRSLFQQRRVGTTRVLAVSRACLGPARDLGGWLHQAR